MTSGNYPDKKLSGTYDETTGPITTEATALTRPTDTPSPAVRADREHSERADSLDDRSALVRALSGLLHALVTEDTESSTSTATGRDGTRVDGIHRTDRLERRGRLPNGTRRRRLRPHR
jgi:hypothetical protein